MNLIPLSRLPLTVKVLLSCFLITLGFGNIAAGVYSQKYVGLSYDAMVQTYSERQTPREDVGMPENVSGEIPITLGDIEQKPHTVNLQLLLQDAHVHIFSHGVLSLLLGILFIWTGFSKQWKLVLIPLPVLGGLLDFAGMFLVKFVADGFAYLILFAGTLMGVSFTIAFFRVLYELWFMKNTE